MMNQWIGGGIAGTGAAMQFMAQRKREKAMNRVAEQMRKAGEANTQENFQISDNLRRALESVATERGGMLSDYFQRRVSPERMQAAETARTERTAVAQGGLERAMASLRGPEGAYEPAGHSYQESREGFMENREQPQLQAVLDQLAAEGYLTGGRNYDTQNQQTLALDQRPLDNEAELRMLLTGVRQGETQYDFNTLMAGLNRQMEEAQKRGAKEAFWGSILQNIGTGVAGGSDFKYVSDATGQEGIRNDPRLPGGGYDETSPGALDLPGVDPTRPAA